MYVGAFLQKEMPEGGAVSKTGDRLRADNLHPIGTFAHVHTIHHGGLALNSSAMVLLVGHRRLKLEKVVRHRAVLHPIKAPKDTSFPREDRAYFSPNQAATAKTLRGKRPQVLDLALIWPFT